ncbi:ShlB/FhaC/HecB family hemolysin secretion/activation protein [Paraburkholderia megapolitana]|uniref:Hemolysin activation/secretion protein n=2 Tax=Paraburkholderia megapolitana TaxID=420953 RepID=A0A1I3IZ27_9BURK|nr:ShlB/FhaC/HecB family hemolysin secretion/activation protein [Paraburkholderia megapolitana]SFI53244.1 hemolysin activation/secretion protein [Paraburkholderia megapolitana]
MQKKYRKQGKKTLITWAMLTSSSLAAAQALPIPAQNVGEQDQRVRQQQEAREREQTVNAPAVRSTAVPATGFVPLPVESPCFRIQSFVLDVPSTLPDAVRARGASALPMDQFAFASEWLNHYAGQCVGKQGLDVIVKGLSQTILSRGYVTTRVLVPEQDLSSGTLKLALIPGVIRQLRFADPKVRGTWKSAFPARGGDLLNLRDLEQGLEQMKRVSSQDVDMQIVPTDVPGESDVVVTVKRTKPWTLVASVDNSGARATGKLQGNVSLGIDNPLGLNDIFNIGINQDLEFGDRRLGSHGWNGSYSVPWGYWTGTLFGYTNTYYQQIAGVNRTFVSSGNSQTAGFKLQRVIRRSQDDVLGVELQLTKRWGASFIEDTEIPQQHRDNTFVEAGLTDRHYFGSAQFDGTLAYRQGIGWLGAMPDTSGDGPTYRFHMAVLDANLSVPFAIANQNLRYVTTFHGQFTNDTLNYIDDLTIGSRYTVRGFDGETMLAAERGFYWRNELQLPIGQTGQSVYAGIDYGHVFGPSTAFLAGTQLAGAVIGVRGALPVRVGGFSYDLFAGTPICKPSGFRTARVTVGFQATAQF